MPRTPAQNQTIKDRRRSKLLLFALKAFAEYGYDHTAIDDITRPAKCSHGLFYHYFSSKEAVFDALIDEVLLGADEVPMTAALELGGTKGLRLLAEYAEKSAKVGSKALYVAKITIDLRTAKNLNANGKAFQKQHNILNGLTELFRQGQEEGKVVAGNPKDIAIAALDLAQGAIARLVVDPQGVVLSSDLLFGLILKGPIEE